MKKIHAPFLKILACTLLFSSTIISCNNQVVQTEGQPMRYTSENYAADWKAVEKMEEKGMGKSIIEKTDEILQKAVNEKNAVQIFKALVYRSKYIGKIEEDAHLKILEAYEKQIAQNPEPLKSLLHSATAELYHQYYLTHRWQFQNRSKVVDFDEKDLRSWSLDKIKAHIVFHYRQSLKAEKVLQNTPLPKFKEVLLTDSLSLKNRPDLYGFLADRALEYFKRNEGAIRPFDKEIKNTEALFKIDQPEIESLKEKKDTLSNHYNTINILQNLIDYYKNSKLSKSLTLERQLERLEYARSISTAEQKNKLYLAALNKLENNYTSDYNRSLIGLTKAEFYYQIGNRHPNDSLPLYEQAYQTAMRLCNKISKKHTILYNNAALLKEKIQQKNLSIELPKIAVPNTELEFEITYKNYTQLYFKLYKMPLLAQQVNYNKTTVKTLNEKKALRKWKLQLPASEDYRFHKYTTSLDNLDAGSYAMVVSGDSTFNSEQSSLAYGAFQSSNIAYFSRKNTGQNHYEIYLRDRTDGSGINQATLKLIQQNYDRENRTYYWEHKTAYTSDQSGYIAIQKPEQGSLQFYVAKGNDSLLVSDRYYYSNSQKNTTSIKSHLFTDRAIYKPGQIVHFKGIVIAKREDKQAVKPKYTQTVELINANGKSIREINLTTNEFGSYQGSFVLPTGDLKGQYSIKDRHGSRSFSVEAYKPPSFEVVFDSIDGNLQLNKKIKVSGKVQRYSGGEVENAAIKYYVIRQSQFPFWGHYRPISYNNSTVEIANGTIASSEEGKFSFEFLATASEEKQNKYSPIERFEIHLEVTAPDGEVQGGNKVIRLGHQAFYLSTNIGNTAATKELKNLIVFAKNIAQKKVDQQLKLQLWKLKEQEKDISQLKKSSLIVESKVAANENIQIDKKLQQGAYLIEVSAKDSSDNLITFEQRLVLYNAAAENPATYKKLWFQPLVGKVEVNDQFSFLLGSSLKDLKLLYEIEQKGKIVYSKWLEFDREQKKYTIEVGEKYRGGFSIHLSGIRHNEFLHQSHHVDVPFNNKKLQLKLSTYRDLVAPGSEEKWTLTVKKENGENVNAEVLIGMYSEYLDGFRKQNWDLNLYRQHPSKLQWSSSSFGNKQTYWYNNQRYSKRILPLKRYPKLNWFGFNLSSDRYYGYHSEAVLMDKQVEDTERDEVFNEIESETKARKEHVLNKNPTKEKPKTILIRKDFRETAFFYPQKKNNKDGSLSFHFTMPDALTKWKFKALAHTKSLEVGSLEYSIKSQKNLMIFPNLPRFVRAGDQFAFSSSIENNSEQQQNGMVKLAFFDAISNSPIDIIQTEKNSQNFHLQENTSSSFQWTIKIPDNIKLLRYKIIAESNDFSDGQEGIIAVLPNKKLITESLPLPINSNETKTYDFPSLLKMKEKEIQPTALTIELSANPVWYAIQALPYLTEYNSNNADQVFHAFFANSLARKIVEENEKIQQVFELWKTLDSDELTSKLEQNEELKEVMLNATPWLQEAKSETAEKHKIANLFESNNLQAALSQTADQLISLQLPNGGWPWFKGMRSSQHITSVIVEGFGRLKQMGVHFENQQSIDATLKKAIVYLDENILKNYKKRLSAKGKSSIHLRANEIQYLYLRSFYNKQALKDSSAMKHYLALAKTDWQSQSMMMKAYLAIAVKQINPKSKLPQQILLSLEEHAIENEEMGMYWKNNRGGWQWYHSKIESQAMMIAAFQEIIHDQAAVDKMKIWLLKQKQTQSWRGTKANALAIYSLLMQNDNLLEEHGSLTIQLGKQQISTKDSSSMGTAYLKKQWVNEEITADMGNIKLKNEGNSVAWGAAYLQYYQAFDNIEAKGNSGLKLSKSLFKVEYNDKGKILKPIDKTNLKLGDKVVIRLRIENDRPLDFVHLQDQPAMAFEPTTTLSTYRSQDGLYYYQTISDAATDFYFEQLPKGVYVFEYEMKVTQFGEFSNGPSSIQSYYAPEFKAYSKSGNIKIFNN